MPGVTIQLMAELAGRMCNFVHTAMIDGRRGEGASRVVAMSIPISIMEASKAAPPAIDIAAVGGGYRGGGDVLLFAFWRSPLMLPS
jgi:hypothetical protein